MVPVESKVKAGTAAAAVSGLALWALGHYVFKAGVPDVVASWTYAIVPALLTFGAGYLAKHTPRLDWRRRARPGRVLREVPGSEREQRGHDGVSPRRDHVGHRALEYPVAQRPQGEPGHGGSSSGRLHLGLYLGGQRDSLIL